VKLIFVCLVFLLTVMSQAKADVFEPKMADICVPTPSATMNGKIQPLLLLNQLLDDPDVGVTLGDLPGTITPDREVSAVLAGAAYCKKDNPHQQTPPGCPADDKTREAAAKSFAHAQVLLLDYFQRHSTPVQSNVGGYQFTFAPTNANISDFFLNPHSTLVPVCMAGRTSAGTSSPPVATDKSRTSGRLIIRNAVTDLPVAQSSDAFKGLKSASLSITDDVVHASTAYAVQGVVGYGIGQTPVPGWSGAYGELIPFGEYTRQFVEGANPNKLANIDNIGIGLVGDLLFPALAFQDAIPFTRGMYNDLNFVPQVVHSDVSNTDIVSGKFVYTPYIDPTVLAGIGTTERVGDFLVMFTPQLVFLYGDVANTTTTAVLNQTGTYERLGTHLEFSVKADTGVISGFGLNAAYDYQRSYGNGPFSNISLFTGTLSYSPPKQNYWSVQLQYLNGRNLDTLQNQQMVTLGVGLKY
jgi:hypothetical protein